MADYPQLLDNAVQSPGEIISSRLEEKGWSQGQLSIVTGKSRKAISDVVTGRTRVTPAMATVLAAAIGDDAAFWLKADALFQASKIGPAEPDVRRRVRLFNLAPISDMQRRGWVSDTKSLDKLESDLKLFFGAKSLDDIAALKVSTRKSSLYSVGLTIAQRAWCFRVRQMAQAMPIKTRFTASRLGMARQELRRLAAFTKEARRVSTVLAKYGIRFIVVEPLPGIRVDGVAFWLNDESPVIGVSLRFDRIDAFWYTLMHEFSHIYHGDALSVDTELVGGDDSDEQPVLLKDDIERRANDEAADSLIASKDMDSFIRRVGPLYSKQRIVQFAHRVKIHPGIIVGQLQNRDEIGYSANREMLTKVREVVAQTALTDGWGRTINASFLFDLRGV